jgi:hypothetical protein
MRRILAKLSKTGFFEPALARPAPAWLAKLAEHRLND